MLEKAYYSGWTQEWEDGEREVADDLCSILIVGEFLVSISLYALEAFGVSI